MNERMRSVQTSPLHKVFARGWVGGTTILHPPSGCFGMQTPCMSPPPPLPSPPHCSALGDQCFVVCPLPTPRTETSSHYFLTTGSWALHLQVQCKMQREPLVRNLLRISRHGVQVVPPEHGVLCHGIVWVSSMLALAGWPNQRVPQEQTLFRTLLASLGQAAQALPLSSALAQSASLPAERTGPQSPQFPKHVFNDTY